MPDPITRLNAAVRGRYASERELGEGGMATVYLIAVLGLWAAVARDMGRRGPGTGLRLRSSHRQIRSGKLA